MTPQPTLRIAGIRGVSTRFKHKTARLVFELKKDHMIFLVAVGSHDAAYRPS